MIYLYLYVLESKLFLSLLCSDTNYSMKTYIFLKNDSISKQTALKGLFEVKKLVTYIKKSLLRHFLLLQLIIEIKIHLQIY